MKRLGAAAAVAFALAIAQDAEAGSMSTTYAVTFEGSWSKATHPLEFPEGAHFSGLIGATHGTDYTIFVDGGRATEGLERLAEGGRHTPLDQEIKAALQVGTAGALIETGPIKPVPGNAAATFEVDNEHQTVSIVAMIAPSPDWFVGVSVDLRENGQWVAEKTVTAFAWDAGTDVGTTYKAPDANSGERIAVNGAPHFLKDGQSVPVGTFTFVRQ
jgi:Spondin_N